jgi:hypothetical protein
MEIKRDDGQEISEDGSFQASWWKTEPFPFVFPIKEGRPAYFKFSCRSFEGCSTVKWDGLHLVVEIFVRGMKAPTLNLSTTRQEKQTDHHVEDSEVGNIFRCMGVACWQQLSLFGTVGPDSIQAVDATRLDVTQYQRQFHILAGLHTAAQDLRALVSACRADPLENKDALYEAIAAAKGQLDLAMRRAEEQKDPDVQRVGKRLLICSDRDHDCGTILDQSGRPSEKAPDVQKGGGRHLVICSNGDLPTFLRHGCGSVLGQSGRLSVWKRTADSLHVVANEICSLADNSDLFVRVGGPALNFPRLGSVSGKVDVLVFETSKIEYNRSWESLIKSSKINVNRLVVASTFLDVRNRLDVDLTKRGWHHGFDRLMMDCFKWKPLAYRKTKDGVDKDQPAALFTKQT